MVASGSVRFFPRHAGVSVGQRTGRFAGHNGNGRWILESGTDDEQHPLRAPGFRVFWTALRVVWANHGMEREIAGAPAVPITMSGPLAEHHRIGPESFFAI